MLCVLDLPKLVLNRVRWAMGVVGFRSAFFADIILWAVLWAECNEKYILIKRNNVWKN